MMERTIVAGRYDPRWGGFGPAPKFPPHGAIALLLRHHAKTREPIRFFDQHPAGELMTSMTNDIDVINQAVSQNVTALLASVLSMAGIGFDRTRLKVVADPALTHNTHFIEIRGRSGNISVKLENVPAPDNPKTALLACYSGLAALKLVKSYVRYGT